MKPEARKKDPQFWQKNPSTVKFISRTSNRNEVNQEEE